MRWLEQGDGIYYPGEPIVRVGSREIESLRERTAAVGGKARICGHRNVEERVHEMLIVLARGVYVRPHLHVGKPESFHVIDGLCDVILFDEEGGVQDILSLGTYSSGLSFYFRIDTPVWHTVLIRSKHLVFHETTKGPFDRAETLFAPWSPEPGDAEGVSRYMTGLEEAVRLHDK